MNIGEIIRAGRLGKNWSQQELADRLGVHKQSVYRWENNQGSPDMETFKKICNVLGLQIDVKAPEPIYNIFQPNDMLTPKELKDMLSKIDVMNTRLTRLEACIPHQNRI